MTTTKEVIKQVKDIEIKTKSLVDGLISGNYHSIFKGQGIEFSEIRDYRPNDDIRQIDWKVTARMNHPYVKEFIEERDLRVYFMFDFSASGSFGNMVEKKTRAIELAASLMFSAMRNNDNCGMIIFTDEVECFVPARKGKKHILKLLSKLITFEPKSKSTNISSAIRFFSNAVKRKSILFIVSDFYGEAMSKDISLLKNRHDVIALRIIDERERELPDVGYIELEDEETGEQILVDTSDEEIRNRFKSIMKKEENKIHNTFKKNKIDSIEFTTTESYITPLKKFFSVRSRRQR